MPLPLIPLIPLILPLPLATDDGMQIHAENSGNQIVLSLHCISPYKNTLDFILHTTGACDDTQRIFHHWISVLCREKIFHEIERAHFLHFGSPTPLAAEDEDAVGGTFPS